MLWLRVRINQYHRISDTVSETDTIIAGFDSVCVFVCFVTCLFVCLFPSARLAYKAYIVFTSNMSPIYFLTEIRCAINEQRIC